MLSKESRQLLEELDKTQYGRALREFVDDELAALSDVENCESWDDTLGRKHAVRILRRLFSFMQERKTIKRDPNTYT